MKRECLLNLKLIFISILLGIMLVLQFWNYFVCCYSVAPSCPTLCNPMNCSTPSFPVLHHLLELAQIHIHWVGDASQPSHPLLSPSPWLQSFPASGSFTRNQFFAWGDQSIGVSASASVLPTNIQDWFPLRLTGWISLQSKGLNSLLQHHSSKASIMVAFSFLYSSSLTSIHDYWENHTFD